MTVKSEAATMGGEAVGLRSRLHGFTYVDAVLWLLRIALLAGVGLGTIGTLIKGSYSASQWFDFFTFGLTIGGVYALIALGYTMVYGILRLINFAHGDITMTGAFTAWFLANSMDRSGFMEAHPVLSTTGVMLLAMVVCVTVALIVERVCYRPFAHVATLAPLICAIGASFFLQHAFRGMYGSTPRSYPDPSWMEGRFHVLGLGIPKLQPIVIVLAVAAMLFLYAVVQRAQKGGG